MADKAVTVIGLVVEELQHWFDPDADRAPLGGGTTTVWTLAGDTVVPPPWVAAAEDGDCSGCGPYLWVRLARRWRTKTWPEESVAGDCGTRRAITIEAGIARCHPLDGCESDFAEQAAIQWDDSYRIDRALCAALSRAVEAGVATDTGIAAGEPIGPEGMVIVWVQQAHARL